MKEIALSLLGLWAITIVAILLWEYALLREEESEAEGDRH